MNASSITPQLVTPEELARDRAKRFAMLSGRERTNPDQTAEMRNAYEAGWLDGWDFCRRTQSAIRLRKRGKQ